MYFIFRLPVAMSTMLQTSALCPTSYSSSMTPSYPHDTSGLLQSAASSPVYVPTTRPVLPPTPYSQTQVRRNENH